MHFDTAQAFLNQPAKALTLLGMSGVGKTRLSNMLRRQGWFHYSVDYRIGTRYMGEHIVDNFKAEAMKSPLLSGLLRTDSIYISSNITFDNLASLSAYLGQPGNPDLGGLSFDEFQRRQSQHAHAEKSAMLDVPYFIRRAKTLYDYDNFVCDTSGSVVEIANPDDPNDPVLNALADQSTLIYLRSSDKDVDLLIKRYKANPKPMYYAPEFLAQTWRAYLDEKNIASEKDVNPNDFAIYGFESLIARRRPRYQSIADQYGYTIDSHHLSDIEDEACFLKLIAQILEQHNGSIACQRLEKNDT